MVAPKVVAPTEELPPADGPGPIMEEPWNGVGKPPTSPPSESTAALADFRKTCGNSKGSEQLPHYENVFLERRSLQHGPEQWRKDLPETVPGIFQCMLQVMLRHRINGVPGFGAGSTRGATRRSKERPVPHLSDDQKVLNEVLRMRTGSSSTKTEADARYEADLLEYEQKLAAQQKAVADYEAAQRQMEVETVAAAARASAAQQELARQQAAYQAEQDRYARERAEYEAPAFRPAAGGKRRGATGGSSNPAPGGSSVPPLPPTTALESHNPANEASQCLEVIFHDDFEARDVRSSMRWCSATVAAIGSKRCGASGRAARALDNVGAVEANADRPISYSTLGGKAPLIRGVGCRWASPVVPI